MNRYCSISHDKRIIMTDLQIIEALIARDENVTCDFFYRKCRPLFMSIIRHVFSYDVDYDEFVNEFYLYLMENDAHRLRQFANKSTIFQWMKVVAIRYFLAKRDSLIDMEADETSFEPAEDEAINDSTSRYVAGMDVRNLFAAMPNKRYVYVIQRLILDDAEPKTVASELGVTVDNLYNIKKRAIAALTEVALNDIERYGRQIC